MASASKASKKVATPMTTRSFTCQRENGKRSIRAAICAGVTPGALLMFPSFG